MARQMCRNFFSKFSRSYRMFDNPFWLNNRNFSYKGSSSNNNDDEKKIPKKSDYRGLFEKQNSYINDDNVKKFQETYNKITNSISNESSNNSSNKITDEQRFLRPITSFKKYTELANKNSSTSQPPRSDRRSEEELRNRRSSEPRPKARDFDIKVSKPPVKNLENKNASNKNPPEESPSKRESDRESEKEEEYFYRSGTTFKYDTEYDSDIEYPSQPSKPREKKKEATEEEYFYKSGNTFKYDTEHEDEELSSPERLNQSDPSGNLNKYNKLNRKNLKQAHSEKPSQAANVNNRNKVNQTQNVRSRNKLDYENQRRNNDQKQTQSSDNSLSDAIQKPSQNIQPRHKINQDKNKNMKNLKYSKITDSNQNPPASDIWSTNEFDSEGATNFENLKSPISIDSSQNEAKRNPFRDGSQNPGSYIWSRDAIDREIRKKIQNAKFLRNKEAEVRENPSRESYQKPSENTQSGTNTGNETERNVPMFKYSSGTDSNQSQSSEKTFTEPTQKPAVNSPDDNRSTTSDQKPERNNRSRESQNYPKISEANKRLLGLKSIDYLDQASKTTTKYFSNGMSTSGNEKSFSTYAPKDPSNEKPIGGIIRCVYEKLN